MTQLLARRMVAVVARQFLVRDLSIETARVPLSAVFRIVVALFLLLAVFSSGADASFLIGLGSNCFRPEWLTYDAGTILIRLNPTPTYASGPYAPLRSGSVWSYRHSDGSIYRKTVVTGTTVINGESTKAIADSAGFIQYLTNDQHGVRLHGQYHESTGDSIVFVPPVTLLAATQFVTQTNESSGTAFTSVGAFRYSSFFTFVGLENVTGSNRQFNDTIRQTGSIELCGDRTYFTFNLARNVGIVREKRDLYAVSETVELVTTNVKAVADFDGDGKSDLGIYRNGAWPILASAAGEHSMGWGGADWRPAPADYDGDGITDIAVVHIDGAWSIVRSSDGGTTSFGLGGSSWTPVPADYDGDGKADIAGYSAGAWSIVRSSDGGNTTAGWGAPGWVAVPADYDGDGLTDIAVYGNGAWSILRSSDGGNTVMGWGGPGWIPVPADYDGDGKADIAVYSPLGTWSIVRSSDGGNTVVSWGGPGWEPVLGDYDGDGKTDIAVYNIATGQWSIKRSSDNVNAQANFGGAPQDVPLH